MNWLRNLIRSICAEMIKVHGVSCFIMAGDVPRTNLDVTKFNIDPPTAGDPDSFHIPADGSGVITIPENLGGLYIVHASIWWERNNGQRDWTADDQKEGGLYSYIERKDAAGQPLGKARDTSAAVPNLSKTHHHILWEGRLNVGDTIEVFCQQNVIDTDELGQEVKVRASGILTVRRLGEGA
jgi:hypothetical protein